MRHPRTCLPRARWFDVIVLLVATLAFALAVLTIAILVDPAWSEEGGLGATLATVLRRLEMLHFIPFHFVPPSGSVLLLGDG